MTLSTTTDYAIRIILYLSSNTDMSHVSGKIIAEEMKIPYNYFLKIVPKLKDAGLIISHQGKLGGFELLKKPKDIPLYDIITVMEDRYVFNRCLIDPEHCNRSATTTCKAHTAFANLQNNIDNYLKNVFVSDLI